MPDHICLSGSLLIGTRSCLSRSGVCCNQRIRPIHHSNIPAIRPRSTVCAFQQHRFPAVFLLAVAILLGSAPLAEIIGSDFPEQLFSGVAEAKGREQSGSRLGDVDMDNAVTSADARKILRVAAKLESF